MHWLKNRLKKLGITQAQLSERLEQFGIYRSRQAISSWLQPENDVPMLANPREAELLAEALEWTLTEMLIAAGYPIYSPDIPISSKLMPYMIQFTKLEGMRLEVVLQTLEYSMTLMQVMDDAEVAIAEEEGET